MSHDNHEGSEPEMPDISTFTGPAVPGRQFVIQFRVGDHAGTAVIDTGFPYTAVSEAFVATLGGGLSYDSYAEVAGIGQSPQRVPVTKLKLTLLAASGKNMPIAADVAVVRLPEGHDVILGVEILSLGVFVIDGPAGTWSWTIDHSKLTPR